MVYAPISPSSARDRSPVRWFRLVSALVGGGLPLVQLMAPVLAAPAAVSATSPLSAVAPGAQALAQPALPPPIPAVPAPYPRTLQPPTPAEARAIAAEAWLYAYAPLQSYQTFWNQTQNPGFPGSVGGLNRFRHYSRLATPADKDIVTPNNDTPYSWAWLDLRAEPIVLQLPAVPAPRYYVNQWFDLYTHNFAYTGVRSTGRKAGTYLFVGPHWQGPVPPGIGARNPATSAQVGLMSPSRPASVRVMPTSTSAAPGLTMSGVMKWGTPAAATTMSARRMCAAISRVPV